MSADIDFYLGLKSPDELLRLWKWHALVREGRTSYAVRNEGKGPRRTSVRMHRVILNAPQHIRIDHRNLNGLDNRKENLRWSSPSQNGANSLGHKNNTSGYKGVSYRKDIKKYRARITVQREPILIGLFVTAEEAARAYDTKALELFGEFAKTNFPVGEPARGDQQ